MVRRKIMIMTEDASGLESLISKRFGLCPYYVLATVEEGEVVTADVNPNLRFNGHQLGLLQTVYRAGATTVLAGAMEPRVQGMFKDLGVDVFCDLEGTAGEALDGFLSTDIGGIRGRISPGGPDFPAGYPGSPAALPGVVKEIQ